MKELVADVKAAGISYFQVVFPVAITYGSKTLGSSVASLRACCIQALHPSWEADLHAYGSKGKTSVLLEALT